MLSRNESSETPGWLRQNAYLLPSAVILSVIVGASFGLRLKMDEKSLLDFALAEARVAGEALMLMSPSLMARPNHEIGRSDNGIHAHVTSLDPASPKSRPDDWERVALRRLAGGDKETSEVRDIGGQSYLSLMRPLVVEQNCLQCHAGRGYKVGEVRGGLSVNVPMAPLWKARRLPLFTELVGFGVIWLMGLGALALTTRGLQQRAREREENEAKYRDLFENAPVAYHELDRQGIIRRVNRAHCALLGYEADDMLWRPMWEFVAEGEREASREAIRRKLSGEQPVEPIQRRYVRRDGGELLIEVHDSLVKNAAGKTTGISTALMDITARVAAEEAVRASEDKFHTLAKVAPVGIFRTDAEGRSIYMNEAMGRITGKTFEESLGFGWLEGLHPDDRSRVHEAWAEAVRKQLPFKMQSRIVRPNGTLVPVVTEADAVVDAKGMILGYVGTITDVSDLKEAEEALTESKSELSRLNEELERRVELRTLELEDARRVALSMMQDADLQRQNAEDLLKQLSESTSNQVMLWQAVENSPAVVVITDLEANIQYVNPKFTDVTGYSAEEAIGKNARLLKSGEHTTEFYQHLWTTIKAGKTWLGEFCDRKKSGELYWESAMISPVRSTDGEIRQFLAIKEDVTEIKRTAEELRGARDASEAANRAKSAFLASMSHEIRTPLNAILGYSQLVLRDASLSAGTRESLRVINRSGEHLLALINDVLEMSKIEAGRLGLEPAEFNLHALLDDLEAMFRLPTMAKGIGFKVTKAKDLPRYIVADGGKTRQVLVNLLGNAVKFTEQGRVGVGASVSQAENGQYWLGVAVEDTGSGIAKEEMGQLFQYFEQTRSGRETQSGTGLGLVISKEYARRMGGDISVASEPQVGSVFRLEIPIVPGVEKPEGAPRDDRAVTGLAPGQAPRRVLVADDQSSNRDWLCALLESVGFEVRGAKNGQEALEIWQAWRPELVLMDMRMPVMDGYEATRQIRSAPGGDAAVIMAVTASTLDERMPAMMDAGVDEVVCKPFRESHLFDKIRTHLGVEYRYAKSEEPTDAQPAEPVSGKVVSLAGLPAELLAQLSQAILGCEMDRFIQLLPQVAELYPSAASSLRALAEKYDYDGLAKIVSESQ